MNIAGAYIRVERCDCVWWYLQKIYGFGWSKIGVRWCLLLTAWQKHKKKNYIFHIHTRGAGIFARKVFVLVCAVCFDLLILLLVAHCCLHTTRKFSLSKSITNAIWTWCCCVVCLCVCVCIWRARTFCVRKWDGDHEVTTTPQRYRGQSEIQSHTPRTTFKLLFLQYISCNLRLLVTCSIAHQTIVDVANCSCCLCIYLIWSI